MKNAREIISEICVMLTIVSSLLLIADMVYAIFTL